MGCDQRNGIRLRQVSYGLFCRKYPVFCICPLIDFINQGNHWGLLFAYLNHSPDTQQLRIKCGNALVSIPCLIHGKFFPAVTKTCQVIFKNRPEIFQVCLLIFQYAVAADEHKKCKSRTKGRCKENRDFLPIPKKKHQPGSGSGDDAAKRYPVGCLRQFI